MLDIKNIEPNVLFVTKSLPNDIFMTALTTIGTTVYFYEDESIIKDILLFHGFKDISSTLRTIHYKVTNGKILLVHVEDFYIRDKFWVQLTDGNLNYIENNFKESYDPLESLDCINESIYQFYDTTLETPFNEMFDVTHIIDEQIKINKIVLSFKYEKDKMMSVRIFHRKGSYVHISYTNYVDKFDHLCSDFIEFVAGRMNVARLINKTKKINLDITQDSDIIDVTAITLDNFHLFWNDFTPEQKLLVEMSAI
jgi:hypothetical protein